MGTGSNAMVGRRTCPPVPQRGMLLKEMKHHKRLNITSIFVKDKEKYESLESAYGIELFTDLDEFLHSNIDIVVEAANIHAVKSLVPSILKEKDVVIISVGALADDKLLQEISHIAQIYNHSVHLPSGAIGGLDLLQNAYALSSVTSVSLTTRKPAHSLTTKEVNKATTIFEGKAIDAIKKYPKNVNVAIVLGLAGIGMEQTTIRLIADPHIDKNIHQIDIAGEFGEATFTISNNPLPENPKTSYLAAMSILGTLQRLDKKLIIG